MPERRRLPPLLPKPALWANDSGCVLSLSQDISLDSQVSLILSTLSNSNHAMLTAPAATQRDVDSVQRTEVKQDRAGTAR